jgi:hypothetical protein
MKPIQIVGLLLIVAGVFVLWKRPMYATKKDVVEIGDFKATVDQREAVPAWLGGVSIGVGVILLLAGARKP